jgi:hypothetical protein
MYRVARAARHGTNLWLVQIISENGGLNYVYKDLNCITWGSTACLWRAVRLNCVPLVGHGQRRRYASCACRGSSCDLLSLELAKRLKMRFVCRFEKYFMKKNTDK